MTIFPRKSSRDMSKSKPYERFAFVHQFPSPPIPDDDSDGSTPTSTLETVDRTGFPTYVQYKRIEIAYLESLSPRKRDKALISQSMFDNIWDVLHHPDAFICTAQFRFWVRKMFILSKTGEEEYVSDEVPVTILHDNRPVAVKEQLYQIFCYCHEESGHGGRDRTFAIIRKYYSWVPKDLTAQFVKACPTCTLRRGDLNSRAPREKAILYKLKEERVEESEDPLFQRGFLKESSRLTGGPHGQCTVAPDRTVDVASSWDNVIAWPSTRLPSSNLQAPSSKLLLLSPKFPSQDFSVEHLREMLANFSPNSGLLSLTSDTTSQCSCSPNADVKLPSLSDVDWDNTNDDQYKLNDLWPENISDSLPPELQRFQLSGPVHTQHMRSAYVNPALLTLPETSGERETGCMNGVSPPSPYSPLGSSASTYSSVSPYSSPPPYPSRTSYSTMSPSVGFSSPIRGLGRNVMPLSLSVRFDLLYSQPRNGPMSSHALPFPFYPPSLSPLMSPFTTAPTSPTLDEEEEGIELLRVM